MVDTDNHQVQYFSTNGTYIAEWGTKGVGRGQFSAPLSVAVDDSRVFVVDTGNNRVQLFSAGGSFLVE